MKISIRCLLCFVGIFIGCQDSIDIDLPSSEQRLVIDAFLGYNENDGNPITIGQIKLTLSNSFFDEEIIPAQNAVVHLIDESSSEVFPLAEGEPGIFRSGFPDLDVGSTYTLEVRYEGEVFRATENLVSTSTIENIEQGDGFIFDQEDETEIIITFDDIPNERNYYLFIFGESDYLVLDDEFFQDKRVKFSYFYEGLSEGDQLLITLFGVNRSFANYVELLLTQSGENGSDLFATPPANIRGNIINMTNPTNHPLGFFAIGEADVAIFTVQ